jgi:hypothetical protein
MEDHYIKKKIVEIIFSGGHLLSDSLFFSGLVSAQNGFGVHPLGDDQGDQGESGPGVEYDLVIIEIQPGQPS